MEMPTMTPAGIPLELLQAFCSRAKLTLNDPLAKPVHIGPWTYFLDRYAGVRILRLEGGEEFDKADLRESIPRIFWPLDIEERTDPVEIPSAPTFTPKPVRCPACRGTGKTSKCLACDGEGEIFFEHRWEGRTGKSRSTKYWVNCDDCNGRGYNSGGDEECERCDGTGFDEPEYPELVQFGDTALAWSRVQKFIALPGAKLYIKRFPTLCLFRGDGWEGVIMPVRAPNGGES